MKLSVIIGFLLGFGIIIFIIFFKQEPSLYLNWAALAVTLGGTLAAVIIYFSPKALKNAVQSIVAIFKDKQHSEINIIDLIIDVSIDAINTNNNGTIIWGETAT